MGDRLRVIRGVVARVQARVLPREVPSPPAEEAQKLVVTSTGHEDGSFGGHSGANDLPHAPDEIPILSLAIHVTAGRLGIADVVKDLVKRLVPAGDLPAKFSFQRLLASRFFEPGKRFAQEVYAVA